MPLNHALITGASEGLGREFARLAARSGRGVVLTARNAARLDELAGELRRDHAAEVAVIPADLSRLEEAERLWAEASDGRRIEVLVNNAGLGHNGRFDTDGWERELASIRVNVIAATLLLKRALPHMRAHGGGKVLNVASAAAFLPGPHMAVYHATKAYLLSLSEAVAEELRGAPVTVTALCPGATDTNFFADGGFAGQTLLNRLPMPSAARVAEAGWHAMIAGRRVKVTGASTAAPLLARILPRSVTTRLASALLARRA